jgi:transposase
MDRQEAERIYDAGKEAVITKLLEMDAQIQELSNLILKLKKKIASLTQNSTNSSKPPSSDGPGVNRYPKKHPSGKKQGAQPGHKGVKRELLPAEEMDKIHDIYPDSCSHCQHPFSPEEKIPSSSPLRHQTFDLPVIVPIKEEYRCHTIRCQCGHQTSADLPPEVAQSNFGPRAHAAIGYLGTVHNASIRATTEIMETLFGLDISTGAVCRAAERVSEACVPVVNVIKRYTAQALYLNIDETGWKNKKERHYLWALVSPITVLFVIAASRGAKVLKEVLGEAFLGIIISDDHSAYRSYHKKGIRQLCWAHIIRKLKALKEGRGSPDAYLFAKNMLAEVGRIFSIRHAFPDSGCSRQQLWLATALIRGRMKNLCRRYINSEDKDVRTRAKRLLDNWEHLFTFLKVEGVEPTNNIAERALRPLVQKRKLCFGSQSEWGERFVERLFTVTRTCQLQGVNSFQFLADLMTATFKGQTLPSLPNLLPN